MILAPYPKILVDIVCKDHKLLKVSLSPLSAFGSKLINPSSELKEKILDWLKRYAQKENNPFPLHLKDETFTGKVLSFLLRVPFGQVTSYQAIANILGNRQASRAVGNACRSNPFPLFVPCHRVIGSNGALTGFAYGLELKKRLIEFESRV